MFFETKLEVLLERLKEVKRFFYKRWGGWDSNPRRPRSTDLQSIAIATMRPPRKYLPPKGIEPSTIRLQVGRSTN